MYTASLLHSIPEPNKLLYCFPKKRIKTSDLLPGDFPGEGAGLFPPKGRAGNPRADFIWPGPGWSGGLTLVFLGWNPGSLAWAFLDGPGPKVLGLTRGN